MLPMPREDADELIGRMRDALRAVLAQNGGQREITLLARSVLLTSFLTEAGFGQLQPCYLRQTEAMLLGVLDRAESTVDWMVPDSLFERLVAVIDEHDRQLRCVRFSAVVDATRRLERLLVATQRTMLADP